jgi:DNA-binding response OmpR family regulator
MTNDKRLKIAIIEDDDVIAQMYRMKFATEGFDVQVAANGRTGVALCQEMMPDMVLLDLKMPEMSGEEALEKIRSTDWGKDIPVIVLTNLGEEEAPKKLKELNVQAYIVKADLTPSQVMQKVKEALGIV